MDRVRGILLLALCYRNPRPHTGRNSSVREAVNSFDPFSLRPYSLFDGHEVVEDLARGAALAVAGAPALSDEKVPIVEDVHIAEFKT